MRRLLARSLSKVVNALHREEQPAPANIPPPRDHYVRWISSVTAGWLPPGNVLSMEHALAHLPGDAPVLEIGSWCGLSANVLTYLKAKHGRANRLVTCDPWYPGDTDLEGTNIPGSAYADFILDTFLRTTLMFSGHDLPASFRLTSDEFFDAWRAGAEMTDLFGHPFRLGGPLSFCYIDGDHTFEPVRRDFTNCDEFLLPGGFLLFDDSGSEADWPEVLQVIRLVLDTGRYEVVFQNPNYLLKKRR